MLRVLQISTVVVGKHSCDQKWKSAGKFIRQSNTWAKLPTSKTPYGTQLAAQLATKLWANQTKDYTIDCFGIFEIHRDYCGHGLGWQRARSISKLVISEVNDGYFIGPNLMAWSTDEQKEFIDWLALQSDFSLSGCDQTSALFYKSDDFFQNNQRINEIRIKEFLADPLKI